MGQRKYYRNYIFYTTQKEIKAHVLRLRDRLQFAKTVPGTESHHKIVPINSSELKIHLLSSDREDMGTKVSVTGLTDVVVKTSQLCPRKYAAAVYDNDWYAGCITEHNGEDCNILVKFMEKRIRYFDIYMATNIS
jgi:hypothetical protein